MSGFETQGLVFSLRNGEICALSGGTLTVGQRQIPLSSIVSAGLVADLSMPVAPGLPPTPGVSLSLADGSTLAFTPVEQLDCWRMLQALAAARPQLSRPLPPPPGQAGPAMGYAGYGGYGPAYGYPPPYMGAGYPPTYNGYVVSESDKTMAGLCHLAHFFLPVIFPLIVWLAMRNTQPYASSQGRQAFIFQLFFIVIAIGAVVGLDTYLFSTFATFSSQTPPTGPTTMDFSFFPVFIGFYAVMGIVGIVTLVYSIVGAVQAFQGRPFHYPLLGRLK